jgi:ATP-dependent helicase/nuclease subunit A
VPRHHGRAGRLAGPGRASARLVFLASERTPPACAATLLAQEQAQRRREELNALYVAMTRARDTLLVSSIVPYRDAPDSWWRRLALQGLPALATPVPVSGSRWSATVGRDLHLEGVASLARTAARRPGTGRCAGRR